MGSAFFCPGYWLNCRKYKAAPTWSIQILERCFWTLYFTILYRQYAAWKSPLSRHTALIFRNGRRGDWERWWRAMVGMKTSTYFTIQKMMRGKRRSWVNVRVRWNLYVGNESGSIYSPHSTMMCLSPGCKKYLGTGGLCQAYFSMLMMSDSWEILLMTSVARHIG